MDHIFGWGIESSLLVLLILGIRRLFTGKISYAGIYALWLVVLFRFLIPVNIISTPFSLENLIPQEVSPWKQTEVSLKNQEEDGIGVNGNGHIFNIERLPDQKAAGNFSDKQSPDYSVYQWLADVNWKEVSVFVWSAVSGSLFLWFVFSNLCMANTLKRKRTYIGMKNKLKIYAASGLTTPCLYGFIRPSVYVPEELIFGETGVRAEREELEQILTHEYVHYRHGDHIWSIFRIFLVSIYWFHPFLWLAVSCSKKDAELFCDETVITVLGEEKRFCYGGMLVRLAGETHWGDFRYSMMSMSRRGKEMERRILAISDRKKYSRWVFIPCLLAVAAAMGITCSAGISPAAVEKQVSVAEDTDGTGEQKQENRGAEEKQEIVQDKGVETMAGQESETDTVSEDMEEVSVRVGADSSSDAFKNYIEVFTEAVNSGNTDQMAQVLAVGTEVYDQQCALVKNYYKRGIREEIQDYAITQKKGITQDCAIAQKKVSTSELVLIYSKEKIKVFYGDGTSKVVKQKYQYTCEKLNGYWIITGMDEV